MLGYFTSITVFSKQQHKAEAISPLHVCRSPCGQGCLLAEPQQCRAEHRAEHRLCLPESTLAPKTTRKCGGCYTTKPTED